MVKDDAIGIQRVTGDVDANQFTLPVQPFEVTPVCHVGRRLGLGNFHHLGRSEERVGTERLVHLIVCTVAHEGIEEDFAFFVRHDILFTTDFREAVKGTGNGESFQILSGADREVHAFDEVIDAFIRSVGVSFADDFFDGSFSDTFDGSHAEADVAVVNDAELFVTLIDVRSEGVNAHGFALIHEFRHGGDVRDASAHDARHIL